MIWVRKKNVEKSLKKVLGYPNITIAMKDLRDMERKVVVNNESSPKEIKCSKERERFAKYKTLKTIMGIYLRSIRSKIWEMLRR